MHKILNKVIWTVVIFLLITFTIYSIFINKQTNIYSETFDYFDTTICIKIYDAKKNKFDDLSKKINEIYKKYDNLSNRYKEFEGINNLFYINYNNLESDTLTIDDDLYKMIEYGMNWYTLSNGLFDISKGSITDVWNSYRKSGIGIPTIAELNRNNSSIDGIRLLGDNKIENTHPNIDLGNIPVAYSTLKVIEYLKNNNINEYFINTGEIIALGEHYNNKKYSVGLEDPDSEIGEVFKTIYAKDTYITSSGGNSSYYKYNNISYSKIINPITLFPSNYNKSVTVITNDLLEGSILTNILYSLSIDDGKKLLKNFNNTEVIWYTNELNEIKTDGINKFE